MLLEKGISWHTRRGLRDCTCEHCKYKRLATYKMATCLQRWTPIPPKQMAVHWGWDWEEWIWLQKRQVRNKLRKEIREVLAELKG